jgi:hypothetical protein
MELFVDFGLFEFLAALGIAALAKAVYARKIVGAIFLMASIGLPAALIFLARSETARWLSALCLATALVNGAVVWGAMQRGDVPTPRAPRQPWDRASRKKKL